MFAKGTKKAEIKMSYGFLIISLENAE